MTFKRQKKIKTHDPTKTMGSYSIVIRLFWFSCSSFFVQVKSHPMKNVFAIRNESFENVNSFHLSINHRIPSWVSHPYFNVSIKH